MATRPSSPMSRVVPALTASRVPDKSDAGRSCTDLTVLPTPQPCTARRTSAASALSLSPPFEHPFDTRSYPPTSRSETRYVDVAQIAQPSLFLSSDEIESVHFPTAHESMSPDLIEFIAEPSQTLKRPFGCTPEGKHIVSQLCRTSCAASCAAMLTLDLGKKPDFRSIYESPACTEETIQAYLAVKGIGSEIISYAEGASIVALSKDLQDKGPAIVCVYPSMGPHYIVLDAVRENGAMLLRDPYHGWQVQTKAHMLQKLYLVGAEGLCARRYFIYLKNRI